MAVKNLQLNDVDVSFHPSVCGSNKRQKFSEQLKLRLKNKQQLEIISCLHKRFHQKDSPSPIEDKGDITFTCFDFIFPPAMNSHFMSEGYYVMSPGWVNQWEYYVNTLWKFDQAGAKKFFRESAKSLMLLDTTFQDETKRNIKALSQHVDLPFKIMPIGLNYIEKRIALEHEKWKNDQLQRMRIEQEAMHRKEKSDYIFTFEVTKEIAKLTDKNNIIEKFKNLFIILFSPEKVSYKDTKDDTDFVESYKIHDTNDGFSILIENDEGTKGILSIEKLKFPENLRKYLNLALYITNIINLSFHNSTMFKKLNDIILDVEEAKESAEKANETKNQLFSIIAHDIRAPMANIVSYIDYLKTDFDTLNRAEIQYVVSQVNISSQHLILFLTNLLNWAKTQLNQIICTPSLIPLAQNIEEELLLLRNTAMAKNITISSSISEQSICYVDIDILKVSLRNIVSNAIKFSNSGSEIQIKCSKRDKYCVVSIRDYGIGMAKEQKDKLFTDIFSTMGTNEEKGTGLGLITSFKLIEKNHGHIEVESEPGKGTCFYLYLPSTQSGYNSEI